MKDYKEIADKAREILFVEIDGLEDLHICLLDEYKRKNALSTIVEYCLEKNHFFSNPIPLPTQEIFFARSHQMQLNILKFLICLKQHQHELVCQI